MNCIDYVGVCSDLPTDIKYFKEELIDIVVHKNDDGKDIHNIISVSVDCDINSMKIVNTKSSTSNEGQRLSGKKLLIDVSLNYRIKYTANTKEKYIYILKGSTTKIMYIVVPKGKGDVKIDDLIRRKKITVEPIVEDIYVCSRGIDQVYLRTLLLLNANVKS